MRSIDASTRSLPTRQPGCNLVRRGSAPAQRQEAVGAQVAGSAASLEEAEAAEYTDRFLSGYRRGRLLGRGACAVVWLAAPLDQRHAAVAVKQVAKGTTGKKKSDAEAARKEISFGSLFFHAGGEPKLSPAQHPGIEHITKLLDFQETKRDIWLVMEYGGTSLTKMAYEIKGEFLRGERLYRVDHLPLLQSMKRSPAVLKSLLRQLLSGLCILADHHIVHSDIKPDNILVEEDGHRPPRVRFIDLGSAFAFDRPESLALATPEYMPPEALESCASRNGLSGLGGPSGRGSIGSRAAGAVRKVVDVAAKLQRNSRPWSFDVWSLGAILLELCVGTPLWLSYKCRVADDQRTNSAAIGLFAVPGRDPEKILQRQGDLLRQRGLPSVLRNAPGVPLPGGPGGGQELLALMLAWDAFERIAPRDALRHPWLQDAAALT